MLKAVCNFLLAWLVFFSSVGFTLYQVTRPNFIANQAQSIDLYDQLSGELGSISPINLNGIPLTSAQEHTIVTNAINQTTFYNFFAGFTNSYVNWLTGRSSSLSFSYPMTEIKTNLQNSISAQLISPYNNLPVCENSQLTGWQASNGLPSCQLANNNILSANVDELLSEQATKIISQIPDTIVAINPSQSLLKARYDTIQTLKIIELIWLVTLGFIVLYLLAFRTRGFLSLSFIFILAGLLEVAFGFVGWDWLSRFITDSLQSLNQTTATAVISIFGAALKLLQTTLGNLSIISLSIGGLFLILGIFYKFKKPLAI